MIGSWLIRKLFMKGFEAAVDSVGKSALEQDFGEANEDNIIVPDAVFRKVLPLTQMAKPLHAMFHDIDGLRVDHATKIGLRLKELPIGKEAKFQYQVKDAGTVVELQVTMTKEGPDQISIAFRSSNEIIATITRCFATDKPE
jgi:hypothetical protein